MQNSMEELFFELLRLSIGNQESLTRYPSPKEWSELYKIALKQSLVGICFIGVRRFIEVSQQDYDDAGPPMKIYHQWLGLTLSIQQRNELMNLRCVELQSNLRSYGIRSSILKGQVVSRFYGDYAAFRQAGDIDLYVDCSREKTTEYARSIGIEKVANWDYKHLHLNAFKDVAVELHYRPDVSYNPFKNLFLQRFWFRHNDDFFNARVSLGCGEVICPTHTMHIFYMIHHVYRHVISGGVGLRQIMDLYYAIVNRNVSEDIMLKEWIRKAGLMKISEALMWLLQNVFGVSLDVLPLGTNEKEGQFLLNEIMIGGNFGKADKRYGNAATKFAILLKIAKRNMHLIYHYRSDALFVPMYYIWHFFWKCFAKKY